MAKKYKISSKKNQTILTINCGSSSIKYKLFQFPQEKLLAKGEIEKIGEKGAAVSNHVQGIESILKRLIDGKVLEKLEQIDAIGHRVVHGAEEFDKPVIINNKIIQKIKKYAKLAPLHNPINLQGIYAVGKIIKNIPQVAVFDTAFHQSLPDYAYMYAIAPKYYRRNKIRRYGFHGTSHQYVAHKAAEKIKKPFNKARFITCHLGNGCSITAIDRGKSIDTSMGFTPLEGLVMGTRCGDIDAAAVLELVKSNRGSAEIVDNILNKKSGLLGLSGISNDFRVISKKAKTDKRARLALDIFIYRIKKYIGAYYFILSKVDAVCFTAGIGEHNPSLIRELSRSIRKVIPKAKIITIPTDEEKMIAFLTYKKINNKI
jgi:acetate kinase